MKVPCAAIALLSCLAAGPARADDAPAPQTTYVTIEQATLITDDGDAAPAIDGFVFRLLQGPFGAYSSFYVDRNYAEAMIGPAFAPTEWLAIGLGFGLEQTPDEVTPWRVGGAVWVGTRRLSLLTFAETGGTGFWARTEFNLKLTDWGGLGALCDLAVGAGPRLEFNVPKTPLQIWWAPLMVDFDTGAPVTQFGIRLNM